MSDPLATAPLEFDEARHIVIETVRAGLSKVGFETIALEEAHGRILAGAALADRDYPALARSLRDGYAVRSADVPGVLRVCGEVRAGESDQAVVNEGEALQIMTGAPVPQGADAVVMVEHVTPVGEWTFYTPHATTRGMSQIKTERAAEAGQFINKRGAESQAGSTLIPAGTRIDASHIATLAMTGCKSVQIVRAPRVAILATGDEIVALEQIPAPHQTRNSNSYMLQSLVRSAGGTASILPVAGDTEEELLPLLRAGLELDMLVVSGGVSAGKYDLVKPTLRKLGVEFHFERVRMQPGQPTAFGTLAGRPVFGLPGNPGSSLITFQLFAKPALELLAGDTEPLLPLLSARFEAPFRHKLGLTRFLPARLSQDGQHLRHIPWQGSSDIPALARANAFLVADHDRESWDVGDTIRVMLKP